MTSLDDLDDTPLPQRATPFDPEVRGYLRMLGDFLDREDLAFAHETLDGIRITIQRTGFITPGQREAVENIHLAALKKEAEVEDRAARRADSWPSRRYEGFGR